MLIDSALSLPSSFKSQGEKMHTSSVLSAGKVTDRCHVLNHMFGVFMLEWFLG